MIQERCPPLGPNKVFIVIVCMSQTQQKKTNGTYKGFNWRRLNKGTVYRRTDKRWWSTSGQTTVGRESTTIPRPEEGAVSAWLLILVMGRVPSDWSHGHRKRNAASAQIEAQQGGSRGNKDPFSPTLSFCTQPSHWPCPNGRIQPPRGQRSNMQ